ncbi:MAG: hypothetical protein P1S60_08340, partial [Anaerolineae bacterium]|nr:hypothetical protein [Anaerolineae bacterium]
MLRKVMHAWLMGVLVLLSFPAGVLALPPIPYGPYGTVQINGAWVPDGTMVLAYCSGVEYGSFATQFAAGASRYSMSVLGDDPATPEVEGCVDGETVTFTVDGWT